MDEPDYRFEKINFHPDPTESELREAANRIATYIHHKHGLDIKYLHLDVEGAPHSKEQNKKVREIVQGAFKDLGVPWNIQAMLPLPISATPGLPVGVRHASEFTTWAESKITKKNFYPTGEDREAHLSKLMAKDAEVIRQRTEYETREREREQRHKADIRAELDARIERFRNDPGAYFVDFSPNAPIPEKYHRPSDIIALKPINLGPKRDIALFHNPKTDECVARDVTGMSEEAISQFADEDEYQLLETRVIAVADLRHLRASPSKIEQSYQKALEIAKGGPSPD